MAQTILSNQQSTLGDPYVIYTISVSPYGRTSNSVGLSVTVTTSLKSSASFLGTGYILTGTLAINGASHTIDIKGWSDSWTGTTAHTTTVDITVTGLSASATSITDVTFSVTNSEGGSGTLSSTVCSNITIDAGNSVSSFTIQSKLYLGDSANVTISSVSSSNYHKIVATSGSNSYTFSSNASTSATLNFTTGNFLSWFDSTSSSITIKITVTTYDSSGSSVGDTYQNITLLLDEATYRPGIPTAVKSAETADGATITLTKPSFNGGATFSSWEIIASDGTATVSGDTVTASVDSALNKTVTISIRAIDSRGFTSDFVDVVYHIRKRGFCVYVDGIWKHCNPVTYMSDSHKKTYGMVYDSEWKK